MELQHFLETVFTLHTNRGSDCDLEDLLDEAAYANGLKFSMIFFGLSARIGAEHPKSIGATTAFQEVFFKELNTDKFSVFPQVGVRYGIGVGSVWKRHDLAVFALPKADVIASCGISGKLDSKKSHLVTVIEILSRSNPSKDTMDNVHLLEKHQIPVYYIVDLNEKRVDEYLFNNNTRKFNAKKTFERSSQDSFIVEPTGVRFFFSDFEGVRRSC